MKISGFIMIVKWVVVPSVLSSLFANSVHSRSLFLNGEDISSARGELLEGVSLRIDVDGHVWITGPQYKVGEKVHYVPIVPVKPRLPDMLSRHKMPASLPQPVPVNTAGKTDDSDNLVLKSPESENTPDVKDDDQGMPAGAERVGESAPMRNLPPKIAKNQMPASEISMPSSGLSEIQAPEVLP